MKFQKGMVPWNKGKRGEYSLFPNGRVFSDETKKKMGDARRGKPLNPKAKAKMLAWRKENPELANLNWWKGRKQPKEMVEKRIRRGAEHYNWKGGISSNPYPPEFNRSLKLSVRTRDGFVCKLCGRTESEERDELNRALCVNHIDFDKSNCKLENLNTLCTRCNIIINYDRDKWRRYFQGVTLYYVSGPITNTDLQREKENIKRFAEMSAILKDQGHEVHNPADFTVEDYSWEQYLARDLKWIYDNKPSLYMLLGWEDSQGARLEWEFAKLLDLVIDYEQMDV